MTTPLRHQTHLNFKYLICASVTSCSTIILCFWNPPPRYVAIARPGDRSWLVVSLGGDMFVTSLFFRDKLYIGFHSGTVMQFDLDTKQMVTAVYRDKNSVNCNCIPYLVESAGEMLIVRVEVSGSRYRGWIEVFKVDLGSGNLVPVKSLGDHALLIGDSRCLSVSAGVFSSIKPNCVYVNGMGMWGGFMVCGNDENAL